MQPHKRWQCLLGPCHVVLHANAACGAALDAVQHCGNKSAGQPVSKAAEQVELSVQCDRRGMQLKGGYSGKVKRETKRKLGGKYREGL